MKTHLLSAVLSEIALVAGIVVLYHSLISVSNGPCIVYGSGPAFSCAGYAMNSAGLYTSFTLLIISALLLGYSVVRSKRSIPQGETAA